MARAEADGATTVVVGRVLVEHLIADYSQPGKGTDMGPGTLVVLVLVAAVFGGAVFFVKRTFDGEGKNTPGATMSSCRRSH